MDYVPRRVGKIATLTSFSDLYDTNTTLKRIALQVVVCLLIDNRTHIHVIAGHFASRSAPKTTPRWNSVTLTR